MGGPLTATRTARVGVLGGTFDPIHVGHLAVARAARDQLDLDEVLVIPAARPPHKAGVAMAPAADRMAMVELAVAGEPGLRASRIELDRAGPSWTVDTLEALDAAGDGGGGPAELTLILSADAFAGLPSWREPDRILRLAHVAVAPRPGHDPPSPDALPDELRTLARGIALLDGPYVDVSATDIRRRVAAGLPIDGLVPQAVARYIEEHHLYRQPGPDERPASKRGHHVTDPAEPTTAATTTEQPRPDGLPHRKAAPRSERPPLEVARRIVELAEDKKAADIVLLDLTGLTTLADAFVICSGGSERQLAAIADGVIEGMRDEKVRPIGREGTASSHWVLLDFGAVVVHIFTPPERDYYSLEKHWSEAKTVLRVQ